MFSTLLGSLPRDPEHVADDASEARLDDVAALAAAGLELVSDGAPPVGPEVDVDSVVGGWQAAEASCAVPVKQTLLGPFSAARVSGDRPEDLADRLRAVVLALAEAGCPFVEIDEPDALSVATDPAAAATFVAAHGRLIDGSEGIHASLTLTGGNLDTAPAATFFGLAYASYAFDLIAGPDNWRLITQAPGDRGIICGALGFDDGADETRELLVWAAHYAASSAGRGLARVGLANAPTTQPITRGDALRRLAIVAEASRIAAVESDAELVGLLDRRTIGPRSASFGRFDPARRRRP